MEKIATITKAKVRKRLHIHCDIAFSILSKLSIKPLRRFKCVCKSWSLWVDSTYCKSLFIKNNSYYDDKSVLLHQHSSLHQSDIFELYSLSGERFDDIKKLEWPYSDYGFNILGSGSVHGILCLSSVWQMDIILWNPSSKECKIIRSDDYENDQKGFVDYGFGYDYVEDDYKVMCLYHEQPKKDMHHDPFICEIYSLRSNSWKRFDVDIEHNPSFLSHEQVYVDGFSHRLCKTETHTHSEASMLSFDWSREIFITTPIPFDIDDILDFIYAGKRLVLLNDSIALILNYTATSTIHILILGEFGVKDSWTKIFIVGHSPCLEYPIGMGKKGDMLFRKNDGGIVSLNLNTQVMEDLRITTTKFRCNIVIHKENHFSLLAFEGKSI